MDGHDIKNNILKYNFVHFQFDCDRNPIKYLDKIFTFLNNYYISKFITWPLKTNRIAGKNNYLTLIVSYINKSMVNSILQKCFSILNLFLTNILPPSDIRSVWNFSCIPLKSELKWKKNYLVNNRFDSFWKKNHQFN